MKKSKKNFIFGTILSEINNFWFLLKIVMLILASIIIILYNTLCVMACSDEKLGWLENIHVAKYQLLSHDLFSSCTYQSQF